MKKKILSIVLVCAMLLGLSANLSFASSSFTDIKDSATANAVEVLRFMGVIDGVGDGKYNPDGTLTRAEFAKLAVVAMNSASDFTKYKNMTIFPDVKAGEWFAPYVNMAAKKSYVSGSTDGYFHPDKTITVGEAVTILLRLIGFTDDEIGGVWPYGHFDFAKDAGLLAGISVSSPLKSISRGDAAKLFVNTISVDSANNRKAFKLSSETVLLSVNTGTKKMKTSGGEYNMLKTVTANSLIGKAGYVVLDTSGNALSFIPKSAISYSYDSAVVVGSSGDASKLTALAGRDDYTIVKNGAVITKDKLAQGDVAVYDSSENKVIVCDTKLGVYYQAVEGSPTEPVSITALGQTFTVLPCAIESIKGYKPGSNISLSLTPSGEIAAVCGTTFARSTNNAVFIVDPSGSAKLICGGDVLDYNIQVSDTKLYGKAVYISYADASKTEFTALENENTLKLDVKNNKLGTKKIADNALVFENGVQTTLAQLTISDVQYYRVNANGEVDLIVCFSAFDGNIVIGSAVLTTRTVGSLEPYEEEVLYFTGSNKVTGYIPSNENLEPGYYIATYTQGNLVGSKKLKSSSLVTKSDFNGVSTVHVLNTDMNIYKDCACYNKYTSSYCTLEEGLALGTSFTLYYVDNVVYLVVFNY